MMNDPTTKYLLMIVGIVAIVGIVYLVSLPSTQDSNLQNNGITGNVVLMEDFSTVQEISFVEYGSVLKTLLGLSLIGACVFMYHKF